MSRLRYLDIRLLQIVVSGIRQMAEFEPGQMACFAAGQLARRKEIRVQARFSCCSCIVPLRRERGLVKLFQVGAKGSKDMRVFDSASAG
jgi:hypothetical protein